MEASFIVTNCPLGLFRVLLSSWKFLRSLNILLIIFSLELRKPLYHN